MHGAHPWIVLLNGVSCSGKSALARALVERCAAPVIHLSLDRHQQGLAGRYANDLWPLLRQLAAGLARSAEAWSRQGFNVVVDTLLETPRLRRETLELLPRDRTFVVGVRAPLAVLLERAASRPEPAEEQRRIRRQFPLVHRKAAYDLELATDRDSPRELAEKVLALVGTNARSQPGNEALAGLRPIEAGDQATFTRAAKAGEAHTWFHYFPFLHAFGRTLRRELLWEKAGDSVIVYHHIDLDSGPRLSLYLPPFPFAPAALAHAQRRCRRFDPESSTRILWVEDEALPELARSVATKRAADEEYVFDGRRVAALAGGRFARLRRLLDRLERVPGLAVRPYAPDDRPACEALIDAWRGQPKAERVSGNLHRLAALTLAHHDAFERGLLRGEVVTVNGEVHGVTFGGPIGDRWGSLFVVLDDRRIPALGALQRHSFMCNNPDIRMFKELGDADAPQLAGLKAAFDPSSLSPLWRVVLRAFLLAMPLLDDSWLLAVVS